MLEITVGVSLFISKSLIPVMLGDANKMTHPNTITYLSPFRTQYATVTGSLDQITIHGCVFLNIY